MGAYVLRTVKFGALACLLIALYSLYFAVHEPKLQKQRLLASLLDGPVQATRLDPATKHESCRVRGSLPDHDCTPGAIFETATPEIICVSGYTKTVRNVSVTTKKKVYAMYELDYPPPYGSYEADHLIPLALGGNNEITNLFPESAEPRPGFKEKDVVENYLHEQVCQGRVALNVAQEIIATNWLQVYENIDQATIQALKNKYPNWAGE
jgi:hypothetical protein